LGFAAAQCFAAEGADVVICSRTAGIDKAAELIRSASSARVLAVRADLTRQDDIERLVHRVLEAFGRIDILVANSGGPPAGTFLSLSPDDWVQAFHSTLLSTVLLCRSVVPPMLDKGGGSIVASQSFTVKQPADRLILSNSLRPAVIGLVKSLANELGPKGIRVNSINPGWTRTERAEALIADRARAGGTSLEAEEAKINSQIPLGRLASPEEYARAVVWLASPAASYVNGHALIVDGGIVKALL
jgi:3-oxoacyl-[acyl-carrier protein] reductase